MNDPVNRRPLRIREQAWVHHVTHWCLRRGFTPNSISLWSIVFSAIVAGELVITVFVQNSFAAILFVSTPLFIGLRGMCNLIDGLLAVEGGLKTRSGEVFNDVPDRISDSLIFVAAGYSASFVNLGWMAALLAVGTAYARMLRGISRHDNTLMDQWRSKIGWPSFLFVVWEPLSKFSSSDRDGQLFSDC